MLYLTQTAEGADEVSSILHRMRELCSGSQRGIFWPGSSSYPNEVGQIQIELSRIAQ